MQVETDRSILFWHGDSPFSNWYRGLEIKYQGFVFDNSEALFMYLKCKFFNQEELALEVTENQDPAKVKKIGRKIKNYNEKSWAESRVGYMKLVQVMKFGQHPELNKILLATGDKQIIEASPLDNIWGVGMYSTHPDVEDPEKWKGQNLLGKVLESVRKVYRDVDSNFTPGCPALD